MQGLGTATLLKREVPIDFQIDICKHAVESGEFHVMGYAATSDFDKQGDILTAEALKAAKDDLLQNSTVLENHDLKRAIGRVVSVKFDKRGLLIDVLISSTEPEIIQKIKEGVLNKFSIRGAVLERKRKFDKAQDRIVNYILRVSLSEVSLVSVPANPEAKTIGWYITKALEGCMEDEILKATKLGDWIRNKREELEITTERLASAMGISPGTLSGIERGRIKRPPDQRLRAAARILGVSFDHLLELIPANLRKEESDELSYLSNLEDSMKKDEEREGGAAPDPKPEGKKPEGSAAAATAVAPGSGKEGEGSPSPEGKVSKSDKGSPEEGKGGEALADPKPKVEKSADPDLTKAGHATLTALLVKLDMISEAGDAKVKALVVEAKAIVQDMMSRNPSPAAGAAAKGSDLAEGAGRVEQPAAAPVPSAPPVADAKAVAVEVSKQLTAVLDRYPTLRKGLVPAGGKGEGGKEGSEEEVIKAFDKLEPSDKLKALLTVEHAQNS